jgi:hypothetical protein
MGHAMHQYNPRPFTINLIGAVAIGLQVSLEAQEQVIGTFSSPSRPVVE